MWIVYALLSAFFAALTSILAKIGIENINSNLATAIRTVIVLILSWAIVFVTGIFDEGVAYETDEKELEEFEKRFNKKEKAVSLRRDF